MIDEFEDEKNRAIRMKFVEDWAEFVRTHPDKEWSSQQKVVVDSQLESVANSRKLK